MIKSRVPGCTWPAILPKGATDVAALLFQLEQTQWAKPRQILKSQAAQMNQLANFAKQNSSFYRDRICSDFHQIPLLTRQELAQQFEAITCKPPAEHLPLDTIQTSGSTGEIVKVIKTQLSTLFWYALGIRTFLWHGIDVTKPICNIRAWNKIQDKGKHDWGPPMNLLFKTGIGFSQNFNLSVQQQWEWLRDREPYYLMTYPTNLASLLDLGLPKSIKTALMVGELVSDNLHQRCAKAGINIIDVYSAQEVGSIAIQCPVSGMYHIQSESLFVEVLNESNKPCKEGEVGRVIVTDLHNFATPLIRYEIRDYAEAGPACPCGRGLPTLKRIWGRRRNMLTYPDGSKHWPLTGYPKYHDIAPIEQYQIIQHDIDDIEVKLVVKNTLSIKQETELTEVIQKALGYPFSLRYTYCKNELPRTEGGKFEEFLSKVDQKAL